MEANRHTLVWTVRIRLDVVAVVVLLMTHAALLAYGAWCHSPAWDEIGHLPAGLYHWKSGGFDAYVTNPPLVRLVAALPVLFAGPAMDWYSPSVDSRRREEFYFGDWLFRANGPRAFWFFTLARWACIPFSLLGGIVCFLWANDLFGGRAGLLALSSWCFCPNVVGHGQLITPDVGAASLGAGAVYLFWRWLKDPGWLKAVFVGAALGLAELSKFTWIVLFGIWPLVWVMWMNSEGWHKCSTFVWRHFVQFIAILVIALYVLNLGYGCGGTFQRLDNYLFVSRMLSGADMGIGPGGPMGNRFAGHWLGKTPVPLPKDYLRGIDLQKLDFEQPDWSYLRGEWRRGGWWYYYLYALIVKVPIGTWVVILTALALLLFSRDYRAPWRDELVLLAPAIVVLILVSSHTAFSRHLRYVLPMFPFVFVWASRAARTLDRGNWRVAGLVGAALLWSVLSSLWHYPHSLAYFNEVVGGPLGGPAHLLNSNVDWGQDLLYLRAWARRHPEARPLAVAYTSRVAPGDLGLDDILPPTAPYSPFASADRNRSGPRTGWYALSVNKILGYDRRYDYFWHFRPVGMAGYSIYIYHIGADDANEERREMGLPQLSLADEP